MGNELDGEDDTQIRRNVAVLATDTDWFAVWDGTDGERATVAEGAGAVSAMVSGVGTLSSGCSQ